MPIPVKDARLELPCLFVEVRPAVEVGHPSCHVSGEPQQRVVPGQGEPFAIAQQVPEGPVRHPLQHQRHQLSRLARAHKAHDVRVLQHCREQNFCAKR